MTNKQIKEITNLRDKSKARRELGMYIVEGLKMFAEAEPDKVVGTFVTSSFAKDHVSVLAGRNYEIIDDSLMQKLSDTKTPQGVLCVVRRQEHTLEQILENKGRLYVILEDIQDPGNLGTIMRTGEGAGVAGVIMSKGCVDIYNPKTIRSTMGSIYRVPFVYVDDLGQAIDKVRAAGIKVYAAHLKGQKNYCDVSYARSAFLIGNEGNGLTDATADKADEYIRIPMEGKVESLNAAVATSILMYEHLRQQKQTDLCCEKPKRIIQKA